MKLWMSVLIIMQFLWISGAQQGEYTFYVAYVSVANVPVRDLYKYMSHGCDVTFEVHYVLALMSFKRVLLACVNCTCVL